MSLGLNPFDFQNCGVTNAYIEVEGEKFPSIAYTVDNWDANPNRYAFETMKICKR